MRTRHHRNQPPLTGLHPCAAQQGSQPQGTPHRAIPQQETPEKLPQKSRSPAWQQGGQQPRQPGEGMEGQGHLHSLRKGGAQRSQRGALRPCRGARCGMWGRWQARRVCGWAWSGTTRAGASTAGRRGGTSTLSASSRGRGRSCAPTRSLPVCPCPRHWWSGTGTRGSRSKVRRLGSLLERYVLFQILRFQSLSNYCCPGYNNVCILGDKVCGI